MLLNCLGIFNDDEFNDVDVRYIIGGCGEIGDVAFRDCWLLLLLILSRSIISLGDNIDEWIYGLLYGD
jgi:hypothetical protein